MALLQECDAGQANMRNGVNSGASVRVFSSPNYQAFTTNSMGVYLMMPAAQLSADYMQALVLAQGFRDCLQIGSGAIHPPYDPKDDTYALTNYDKNLDIALDLCKIVQDYESRGIEEPLMALKRLDFGLVYEGYKSGLELPELMDIYIQTIDKAGLYAED